MEMSDDGDTNHHEMAGLLLLVLFAADFSSSWEAGELERASKPVCTLYSILCNPSSLSKALQPPALTNQPTNLQPPIILQLLPEDLSWD